MDTNLEGMKSLAQVSGLTPRACAELTSLGYVFIREISKPSRWEKQF